MLDNPALNLADMRQRLVPARLQLSGDEAVGGIGRVILSESPVGGIASCLQIPLQELADLVTLVCRLLLSIHRRGDSARPDDTEKRFLDGIIDPQASKRDAAWLASPRQQE